MSSSAASSVAYERRPAASGTEKLEKRKMPHTASTTSTIRPLEVAIRTRVRPVKGCPAARGADSLELIAAKIGVNKKLWAFL